jgi:hypothetical protein
VGTAAAQSTVPGEFEPSPTYAYAVFAGSGVYTLDDRRAYILRMPFSWTWRHANHETGEWGAKLLLPVTVGVTDFDNIEDLPDLSIDNLSTLTFVPGVDFEYVLRPNLFIKPFVHTGIGWEFQDNEKTFVWGAGVRARLALPQSNSNWLIGGEILVAGDVPGDDEPSTDLSRISLGVEYKKPLSWRLGDRQTALHTQLIGYHYVDEANFNTAQGDTTLRSTVQLGFAVGVEPAIKVLGFSMSQIGIGFRYGEDFSAITLVTSFPF